MRTPRTRRKQPPPSLSEGAKPRCSSLPSLPPLSSSPPPCTPGWSDAPPGSATPPSNKGLTRSGGSLGPVQPPVRRSLRLSATSPATGGDATSMAKCVPTQRSSTRVPHRSGSGDRGELACGGAAEDGEAAGEGEAAQVRVSGSSEAGCYMNLRSGSKIARRAIVVANADRRMATSGGDHPLEASVAEVVVDFTDATVEEPEEDVDASKNGRKRAKTNGRNAPEMGVPVSEDAFSSRVIVEEHDDRSKTVQGFVEEDCVNANDQISVHAEVVVDFTDATVVEPEEDVDALKKGRKRARTKGRNTPEMGVPLSEDAFSSRVIVEEHDHRSETVQGFVGEDCVNANDQISVLASDVKQEDKSDRKCLSLRSGSGLVEFSHVQFPVNENKLSSPEKDRDSCVIGRTDGIMKDDNGVGETIYAKEKGKSILVVEQDDNESVNMDMDITAGKDADTHLGNTDGLERVNDSGMRIVSRREADRARARALASKFAFFNEDVIGQGADDETLEEEEPKELMLDSGEEDWPGPFSTAMKIISERDEKLRARNLSSSSKKDECTKVRIPWKPSMNNRCKPLVGSCPTLKQICMKLLVDHAEEIESLEGIPDILRNKLVLMLCRARKMSYRLLDLLMSSSCAEIHLSDCSWVTEDQIQEIFTKCNTNLLKVVQLDLSGRCMPDYILRTTLAQSPNSLPMLTSLSLKGAYRLSDNGLNAIVASAPSLRSINLSQCSLVTSLGIKNLAENLDGALRELYIDDCYNVDAMVILPALKKIKHLEVLSLAGVRSVCHKFVCGLIPACGSNMREFCLAGCWKVTDSSIKTISEHCPSLRVIDLRNLSQLTDCALKHLANGCQSLQKLKLRQTAFSDGAVAAFLEASGRSLIELTLNNVKQVAEHTALAISRQCSNLQNLDLSFCREMSNEALGIIVDSCLCLRVLKLFGCTQVTDLFLNGHSNCEVKVIGLQGQVLGEIEIPDFL